MLRIHPQNGMVSKRPMRSVVIPEKSWAVLDEVVFAPRAVNDRPDAEYPKYAYDSIPDALTLPVKAGTCPSRLLIVPRFAARFTS